MLYQVYSIGCSTLETGGCASVGVAVLRGDHVLFRDYAFVQATPRNRRAFIRMVWRCFRHLGSTREM